MHGPILGLYEACRLINCGTVAALWPTDEGQRRWRTLVGLPPIRPMLLKISLVFTNMATPS